MKRRTTRRNFLKLAALAAAGGIAAGYAHGVLTPGAAHAASKLETFFLPQAGTIPQSFKDDLNAQMHEKILKLGGAPVDYLASKAAMQPILDEIAKDGWSEGAWSDKVDGISVSWDGAQWLRIRRIMVIEITRPLVDQIRLLELGIENDGVAPGDSGKYERVQQTVMTQEMNQPLDVKDNGIIIVLNEQPVIMALLALDASAKGPRPANWLRDF